VACDMMMGNIPMGEKYTVLVIDMFHYDSDEDFCVGYFPSMEAAREYARRRTRGTVEENRAKSTSPEDLRSRCFSFGEDCKVMGGDYSGFRELDYFITHPATAEEVDYRALEREWGIRPLAKP
jgi:hypothetical protein